MIDDKPGLSAQLRGCAVFGIGLQFWWRLAEPCLAYVCLCSKYIFRYQIAWQYITRNLTTHITVLQQPLQYSANT